MQASLHQERLQRQEQAALSAKLDTDKQQMQHRCTEMEAKLRVLENTSYCDCMQPRRTGCIDAHTTCSQVAEMRADEVEEEQYKTEQELASGRSELNRLHSQNEAAVHQSDDSGHLHIRAGDLAHADSALLSMKAELDSANQRIYQLEQSTGGSVQQSATSGQMYPDGLSRLSTTAGRAGMSSGVGSDSDASSHEATAQVGRPATAACPAARHLTLTQQARLDTS